MVTGGATRRWWGGGGGTLGPLALSALSALVARPTVGRMAEQPLHQAARCGCWRPTSVAVAVAAVAAPPPPPTNLRRRKVSRLGDARGRQLQRLRDGLVVALLQAALLTLTLLATRYEPQADAADPRNSYIPVMGGFNQDEIRLKKHYHSNFFNFFGLSDFFRQIDKSGPGLKTTS